MVAVEDWISPVTASPKRNALNGLSVAFPSSFFSVSDEDDFSPSPMIRIPYKNRDNPPKRVITLKIDTFVIPSFRTTNFHQILFYHKSVKKKETGHNYPVSAVFFFMNRR